MPESIFPASIMLSNICFCQGTCVCVCRVWLLFCSVWILSVPSGLRATNPSQVSTAAKSIHCARFVPPRLLPLVSPYHHLDYRFQTPPYYVLHFYDTNGMKMLWLGAPASKRAAAAAIAKDETTKSCMKERTPGQKG